MLDYKCAHAGILLKEVGEAYTHPYLFVLWLAQRPTGRQRTANKGMDLQ